MAVSWAYGEFMNSERLGYWLAIGSVALLVAATVCGRASADPAMVLPSGLPVQVHPTFPEPGLPAFTFPTGGATQQAATGSQDSSGTQGSSTSGGQGSSTAGGDYQQYVGSYYGPNEQCVSLTRYLGRKAHRRKSAR